MGISSRRKPQKAAESIGKARLSEVIAKILLDNGESFVDIDARVDAQVVAKVTAEIVAILDQAPATQAEKIVINVYGGLVQDVHSINPHTEVEIFDFDIFDSDERDHEGRTKEEATAAYNRSIEGFNHPMANSASVGVAAVELLPDTAAVGPIIYGKGEDRIFLERNGSGCSTPMLPKPPSSRDAFGVAIDALTTVLMKMAGTGVAMDTPAMHQAIKNAVEQLANDWTE